MNILLESTYPGNALLFVMKGCCETSLRSRRRQEWMAESVSRLASCAPHRDSGDNATRR